MISYQHAAYGVQYYTNITECLGILNGPADLILGLGAGDTDIEPQTISPGSTTKGLRLPVSAGDVVIQPAGTAHGQTNAKDDRSIAVFPEIRFPCIRMYMYLW